MKRLRIQVSPPQPERESPQPSFSQPGAARRLPEGVQEKMEGLFGADFSNVRVQVGPQAPSLGALAFTRGSHLHFAPGQYDPATTRGQRLLAHELTHVVQQRDERAKAPRGSEPAVLQHPGLEAEAERMGSRAAERPGSSQSTRLAPVLAPARLQAPDPGAARPIQMALNLGWVPAKPGKWRAKTNKVGNGPKTKGGGDFGKGKRAAVEANNLANTGGKVAAPALPALVGGYPLSDASGKAVLTAAQSALIAPEVDHIVEKADGGANDYENARLLSKAENNNAATPRPKVPIRGGAVADTQMRLYKPINIQVKNGPPDFGLKKPTALPTGGKLTLNHIKALCLWSGFAAPAKWGVFTVVQQNGIQADTPDGKWRKSGPNAAGGILKIKVT